jgi:hypothetical protein
MSPKSSKPNPKAFRLVKMFAYSHSSRASWSWFSRVFQGRNQGPIQIAASPVTRPSLSFVCDDSGPHATDHGIYGAMLDSALVSMIMESLFKGGSNLPRMRDQSSR